MLYCNAEINCILCNWIQPSVLWRCWLGGRKSIRPVKNREWWGAGVVICLEWGADLHMAQLMPLPLVVCCFSKIQTGFNLLVPAHLGSPGKGPSNGCVCVCVNSVIIKLRIANIFGKIRQKSQFNMLPMTMREQKREKTAVSTLWVTTRHLKVLGFGFRVLKSYSNNLVSPTKWYQYHIDNYSSFNSTWLGNYSRT